MEDNSTNIPVNITPQNQELPPEPEQPAQSQEAVAPIEPSNEAATQPEESIPNPEPATSPTVPTEETPFDEPKVVNPMVEQPEKPVKAKHVHRFIFGYIAIIILLGSVAGVYQWQHKQVVSLTNQNTQLQQQLNTANAKIKLLNSQQNKVTTITIGSPYLDIKEWGVKIKLTSPISNATYKIVTNNQNIQPSAFLSTSTLDASAACTAYYQQGQSATTPTPSFQYIERYPLTSMVSLSEDASAPKISVVQAAIQSPTNYIKIGNYVYSFNHGNGMPCEQQTSDILPAFETAFTTIQAD